MAQQFPVVSLVNNATLAVVNHEHNAQTLANKINRAAGRTLVRVGDPIPFNPRHAGDDEIIAGFVDAATAPIRP